MCIQKDGMTLSLKEKKTILADTASRCFWVWTETHFSHCM